MNRLKRSAYSIEWIALAILQSNGTNGTITLTASAAGLQPAIIVVQAQ
jgi:hypothetical protein